MVERIVSGGQTGADRGALDAAIALGIPHGGWCPNGRRAEDGRIDDAYQLREHDSPKYKARTRQNVLDSDATLIVCRGPLAGGTHLTHRTAERFDRPSLVVDPDDDSAISQIRAWLAEHHVNVLNVAGPRESQSPGIQAETERLLRRLFETL